MKRREREFDRQWGDLATYNSEVARGIVHTAEYDALMAVKQRRYDDEVVAEALRSRRRVLL